MVDASDEPRPASEPASEATRERAPSLVEIAEAFIERAPRVPSKASAKPAPERMKQVAEQVVAERAAIEHARSDGRPVPAPSRHGFTESPAPVCPTLPSLPAPSRLQLEPRPSPDARSDEAQAPADAARRRAAAALIPRAVRERPRAWASLGAGVAALGGVVYALAPNAPQTQLSSSAVEVTVASAPATQAVTHAAALVPPARSISTAARSLAPSPPKTAAKGNPVSDAPPPETDAPHLVVRKAQELESCDDVLGAPFAQKPVPHSGKSAAHWSRSRRALLRGKTSRALEEMCKAAAWDIAGRASYGLSEYYFEHADFAQARIWARRVPEASRRYTQARAMIGDIHHQEGEVEAARSAFLELYNIEPTDEPRQLEIAERLESAASRAYAKGDLTTAERFYRRALTLAPENARAAAGLSRVLTRRELLDAARYWLRRATRAGASSPRVAVAEIEWSLASGERTRAQAALQRLRELSPRDRRLERFERRLSRL